MHRAQTKAVTTTTTPSHSGRTQQAVALTEAVVTASSARHTGTRTIATQTGARAHGDRGQQQVPLAAAVVAARCTTLAGTRAVAAGAST